MNRMKYIMPSITRYTTPKPSIGRLVLQSHLRGIAVGNFPRFRTPPRCGQSSNSNFTVLNLQEDSRNALWGTAADLVVVNLIKSHKELG